MVSGMSGSATGARHDGPCPPHPILAHSLQPQQALGRLCLYRACTPEQTARQRPPWPRACTARAAPHEHRAAASAVGPEGLTHGNLPGSPLLAAALGVPPINLLARAHQGDPWDEQEQHQAQLQQLSSSRSGRPAGAGGASATAGPAASHTSTPRTPKSNNSRGSEPHHVKQRYGAWYVPPNEWKATFAG